MMIQTPIVWRLEDQEISDNGEVENKKFRIEFHYYTKFDLSQFAIAYNCVDWWQINTLIRNGGLWVVHIHPNEFPHRLNDFVWKDQHIKEIHRILLEFVREKRIRCFMLVKERDDRGAFNRLIDLNYNGLEKHPIVAINGYEACILRKDMV